MRPAYERSGSQRCTGFYRQYEEDWHGHQSGVAFTTLGNTGVQTVYGKKGGGFVKRDRGNVVRERHTSVIVDVLLHGAAHGMISNDEFMRLEPIILRAHFIDAMEDTIESLEQSLKSLQHELGFRNNNEYQQKVLMQRLFDAVNMIKATF